jgi:uncharacterized membrane protein YkoI
MDKSLHKPSHSRRMSLVLVGLTIIVLASMAAFVDRAGADETGLLDDGTHLLDEAGIGPSDAIEVALDDDPGVVRDLDLEQYGQELVYEVKIDGESRYVDAMTGQLLVMEQDNDEDFSSRKLVSK